jgi:hypothetical protein
MTLVAAWKEHNTPYLIGDVLVSTREDFDFTGDHFPVPTRDDLIDILPRKRGVRIVGAWQKIYKVSNSFAIGWAGNRAAATSVVRALFVKFEARSPFLQDVRNFLIKYADPGHEPCLLVGWIVEDGATYCFRWRSDASQRFELGEEFLEGSGNEHLREILRPTGETGKEPVVNSALGKLANLLGHEVLYGTNLENAFGGWYQLIYYDEGFRVLPSATFVFLSATEGEKEPLVVPTQRFLKSQYENGVLQTMVISCQNALPPEVALHYAYQIFLDQPDTENEEKVLSLVSDYYAVYVDVTWRDGLRGEYVTTLKDEDKGSTIRIGQSTEGFETITLNSGTLLKRIGEVIKNRNPDRATYPTRKWLAK